MNLPADVDIAIRRLNLALDQLEAAAHRRTQIDASRSNLEEELTILQDDRSRLAVELDGAMARNKKLGLANHEVANRLERASITIKMVLDKTEARN